MKAYRESTTPRDALYERFSGSYGILGSTGPLTDNQLSKLESLISLADQTIDRVSGFKEGAWSRYREAVLREDILLLKE